MKEIIYREVEKLVLLEANPRKISDEQMERLKESIDKNPDYFECRPVILSDRTGELVVIAGNQRVKAATAIGLKAVPTILLSGLTEEREKEIIIRDNVNNGEWDTELLAEWDAALLDDWGVDISALSESFSAQVREEKSKGKEAEEDDYEEKDLPAKTKEGDVYQLGEHRLICGDSTKAETIAELMGDEQADMVVTDPPYNVAYEGGTSDKLKIANDNMSDAAFRVFLTAAFSNAASFLKVGGAFYCWYAIWWHTSFEECLRNSGIDVKQQLIWNKNTFTLGRQDYQWKHEPCLYGWKTGGAHYFTDDRTLATVQELTPDIIEKMSKGDLRKMLLSIVTSEINTTILDEKKPTRNGEHPTMKPVRLIARQIANSSREGEIVLDMFGGSGTTIIAAEQLGRKCRMVEYDPRYCDVIIDRWEQFTGNKAKKING